MKPSSNENPLPLNHDPIGVVVGRDLMFTAKITGTASELGYRMRVAGDVGTARSLIERLKPRVILVDLAAGEPAAPQALSLYRQLAGPSAWLVAVGPHVDARGLAAASAAGCQLALPRSKFANELPTLLHRFFGRTADPDEPRDHDGPATVTPAT